MSKKQPKKPIKSSQNPDPSDHESLPSVMAKDNTCDWGLIMGADNDDEESSWSSGSSSSQPHPKPTRRRHMPKSNNTTAARRSRGKSSRNRNEVNNSSSLLAGVLRPITHIFDGVNMKLIVLCIIGTQYVLTKTRTGSSSTSQMTRDLQETVASTPGLRGAMDYLGVVKAQEEGQEGTLLLTESSEELDSTSNEAVFGQNKGFQTVTVQSQQDSVPQHQAFDPSQHQQPGQGTVSQQQAINPNQQQEIQISASNAADNCESRMWHESKVEGMKMTCTNDDNYPTSWSSPQRQKYYLFPTAQKCCETRFGQQCNVVDLCGTTQSDVSAIDSISQETMLQRNVIPQVQPMAQEQQNDSQAQGQAEGVGQEGSLDDTAMADNAKQAVIEESTQSIGVEQKQYDLDLQNQLQSPQQTQDLAVAQQQAVAHSGDLNLNLPKQPDLVAAQQQPLSGSVLQMKDQSQQLSVQPQQDVALAQQQVFGQSQQQEPVQPQLDMYQPDINAVGQDTTVQQHYAPQMQQMMINQPVSSPQQIMPQQGYVQQPPIDLVQASGVQQA